MPYPNVLPVEDTVLGSPRCQFDSWPERVQMWHRVASDGFDIFHRHAGIELNHCEEGRGHYGIPAGRWQMRPDSVTLIWGLQPHRVFAQSSPYCRTVLQFPLELLVRLDGEEAVFSDILPTERRPVVQLVLPSRRHSELDLLLKKAHREVRGQKPYGAIGLALIVNEILLLLARANLGAAPPTDRLRPHEEQVVAAIERMIDIRISQALDPAGLAKEVGLSPGHVRRVFRKAKGVSLRDYIQGRRLDRARQLLEQGVRVTDVAYECGYADVSSFSRAFRRDAGIGPRQYRSVGRA